jgi:ureidoglycolate lyase
MNSMRMPSIKIQPLSSENFLPYGDVIACQGNHFFQINDQQTERYHALAEVESDAKVGLSIFKNIQMTEIPFEISMLERHPFGSQAFVPMQGQQFLIVVAPCLDHEHPDLDQIQAFISDGRQGVNYRAGTWHHPLLTLEAPSDFVVVDRIGTGSNCDVYTLPEKIRIEF